MSTIVSFNKFDLRPWFAKAEIMWQNLSHQKKSGKMSVTWNLDFNDPQFKSWSQSHQKYWENHNIEWSHHLCQIFLVRVWKDGRNPLQFKERTKLRKKADLKERHNIVVFITACHSQGLRFKSTLSVKVRNIPLMLSSELVISYMANFFPFLHYINK